MRTVLLGDSAFSRGHREKGKERASNSVKALHVFQRTIAQVDKTKRNRQRRLFKENNRKGKILTRSMKKTKDETTLAGSSMNGAPCTSYSHQQGDRVLGREAGKLSNVSGKVSALFS